MLFEEQTCHPFQKHTEDVFDITKERNSSQVFGYYRSPSTISKGQKDGLSETILEGKDSNRSLEDV